MTRSRLRVGAAAAMVMFLLTGCGTTTPSFHEFYDRTDSDTMIQGVMEHVQCEVRDAVQFLILDDRDAAAFKQKLTGVRAEPSLAWLAKWDAQITFVMSVDEKTSLNPTAAITPPLVSRTTHFDNGTTTLTPQTLSLGIGGTASVDATRKGTISWLVRLSDLLDENSLAQARIKRDAAYAEARKRGDTSIAPTCDPGGQFVQGDLEFRDWLYTALLPAAVKNGILGNVPQALSAEAAASKKDVIQDDITFVVLYGAGVNPTFKLLRIGGGQASPSFLGVQRTRTQDVLITLGPAAPDGALSAAAQNQALASLIGIAVANAIRNNGQ